MTVGEIQLGGSLIRARNPPFLTLFFFVKGHPNRRFHWHDVYNVCDYYILMFVTRFYNMYVLLNFVRDDEINM